MERDASPLSVVLRGLADQLVAAVQGVSDGSSELSQSDRLDLLLTVCEQAGRLQVAAAVLSTGVDDDGMWATEGARSFPHWLAACTGMSFAKARDLVATGRSLRDHLPATHAAALAGEMSADQVSTMVRFTATSEARRAALGAPAHECGEAFLVEHARQNGADGFRHLARRWAAAADPAADERGYREACEREFLALAPTLGGYHLSGFLTAEHGAVVGAALESVMTPPGPDDQRTTQQRRAQGLADLSRLVLDHGLVGTGAAVRPHLSVVVDFDSLRRGLEVSERAGELGGLSAVDQRDGLSFRRPDGARTAPCRFRLTPVGDVERFAVAEILGSGPIPTSVLARLACDSEISRLVFGPDSQVINAGRAERTFSGPRRKAVIARDGTCRYPGCTAPPALGEIHHIDHWVRDHGDTDINAGILLCWHHHDLVHRLHIDIRRSPTGGWLFLTRHGTPVTTAV